MKAAVQVLKKTEDLKEQATGDFLNDNEAWNRHQKLQELYQQLLVIDLEYALDKKVEQDLWNYVFKNHINRLQVQAKDRKNLQRTECQENLVWFLETASGFYLQLLQELCETFDLDVPCRRKGSIYGISKEIKPHRSDITIPHKSSSLYICQHCLVHMGDIARYRNQSLQAETFYRHAAELVPSNGQPYNQLAILEAAKGDKLSTVFYYVRSIAVKHPFPVAATNLQKMFSKIANDEFQHEGKTKLSVYDYVTAFLQFHALVHLTSNLDKAHQLGKVLATNLTILIATESLTAWKLIQMMAINLFAITHATHGLEFVPLDQPDHESEPLSEDEQTAYNLVLELIASTLNGLLLLVYTMKEDSELRSYYALPVIKISLEWLRQDPSHLKTSSFTSKFQIWPSVCKLLNGLQASQMSTFDANKYADVPLPEDWDLQSFLPLYRAYKTYVFSESLPHFNHEEEHSLRTFRLVGLGKWLCEQEIYGVKLMTAQPAKEENRFTFEAITPQTPSSDVLKLLEEMTVGRSNDLTKAVADRVPLDDASSAPKENGSAPVATSVNGKLENGRLQPGAVASENGGASHEVMVNGDGPLSSAGGRFKGGGRQAKGQFGSADSNGEKTLMTKDGQNKTVLTNAGRERKTRQNVALQTIMQKKSMNTKSDGDDSSKPKSEGKMVTFKTPTPSPPASSGGTPPLALQSTLSPVQHGDVPMCYLPQHHQPMYSVALQKPKGTSSAAYGNGTPSGVMDANVALISASANVPRNPYPVVSNIEPGFPLNQHLNKYNFYGNHESQQPYHTSHVHGQPPGGPGAGGRVLRSPPARDALGLGGGSNAGGAVGSLHNQGSSRMGMTGNPQGNVLALPQPPPQPQHHHGMLMGYNLNGMVGNRPAQQLMNPNSPLVQGPNGRMGTMNHHPAIAAAVALAAQKQQPPFGMNATAMFGSGPPAPPPPQRPPWYHQPGQPTQGSMNITPPPAAMKPPSSIEQYLAQMPHLPPPPGQIPFTMPGQPYGTSSRPPQQQQQQHFPHLPSGDPAHFMFHMMGQMPSDSVPFPGYPPPSMGVVPQATNVPPPPQVSGGGVPQDGVSEMAHLHHGLQLGRSSVAAMENSAAAASMAMGSAQPNLGRHHGSVVVPYEDEPPKAVNHQQQQQGEHRSPSRRLNNGQGSDMEQQQCFEERAVAESGVPSSIANMPSTYSLFNSPWSSGLNLTKNSNIKDKREYTPITTASNNELGGFLQSDLQSLWSGPSPSPLERLLEQQKLKKDAAPH